MEEGATFKVYVPPRDDLTFVHVADAGNTSGDSTLLDNPSTNGNPDAVLAVTQNRNPGGVGGTYSDHLIDERYDAGLWEISNKDGAEIPEEAAFNVGVAPLGEPTFVHRATADDISSNWTYLEDPRVKGDPDAILFVTPRRDEKQP